MVISDPVECPQGYYFNDNLVDPTCYPIENAHTDYCQGYCNPCEPYCVTQGTFSPAPNNCSFYYRCRSDDMIADTCTKPFIYFDYRTGQCSEDSSVCFNYCDKCDAYCVESGNIPDPQNCTQFYLCDPPQKIHFSCNADEIFDADQKICSKTAPCIEPCGNNANERGEYNPGLW